MNEATLPLPPEYREIPEYLNISGELIDNIEAKGFSDRTAFVWDGGNLTFRAFSDRVNALSQGFFDNGIIHGTHVLVRMHNCHEFAVTILALIKIGAVPVLINSLLGQEEIEYVFEHSDAEAIVTIKGLPKTLYKRLKVPRNRIFIARDVGGEYTSLESLMTKVPMGKFKTAQTYSNEPAFIVYTSGTTGRPKGIVHAHRWVIALGDSNRYRVPTATHDRVYATGEWSFISALGHSVIFPLRNGVTGVILEDRPTPENVLKTIETHKVTLMYSVATVYRRILAISNVEKNHDLSSLRGCNATGEALEASTWNEFKKRIGTDIWEHYGISEMQMVLGQGPLQPIKPGSIGISIPGTDIGIIDDDGAELAPDQIGHLVIKSDNPGFFLGYHKDDAKTNEVMRGGWYHTGDLAWRDQDGYFWVAGRQDDCFKSRGIFISPYEIENVLRQDPSIAEACIVPAPDPEIGNRIRAVCVLQKGIIGTNLIAEEVRQNIRKRIAPYKTPHTIEFRESLPKSPVGKILRRELID